ncbi:MAG: sodium/proline symporter [Pseudomonadota bacterium]
MDKAWAFVTLVGYGLALIGIGVWASRQAKSQEAFLLAGRSLGPFVAGLAYAASTSSAWVLLGYSGFVYVAGPSALWMVPGILAGYAAVWLGAGPVLQRASRERGHLTLTDFLAEDVSGAADRIIRVLASLMIAFCFSYYVASQFQGAGVAFTGLFDISLRDGVLIGAVIIVAYTLLGGFLAVSVIDTIQGLLMALVAIGLPIVAFLAVGGFEGMSASLSARPEVYTDSFGGRTGFVALGFVTGLFATGFGALGQPHLIAWIMATRDAKARVMGAGVAISWGLFVYAGMAIFGLSAHALFEPGAVAPEGIFFAAAETLLPPALAGIIAAATLSAIMSTVDSQLLVAGGAVSHDLGLGKVLGGREVLVSRFAILAVCGAAIALTFGLPSTIFERTLFAWTALGASFGPAVVLRAFGQKASGFGVIASMAIGFGVSLAFEFGLPAGPGAAFARTLPWAAAFVPLILTRRSA